MQQQHFTSKHSKPGKHYFTQLHYYTQLQTDKHTHRQW